jgi:hypothetical protein
MRKADQFAVKNFITKQEERARPAYVALTYAVALYARARIT